MRRGPWERGPCERKCSAVEVPSAESKRAEISAFLGATEAVVAAGALVPEEAPEEGECRLSAFLGWVASVCRLRRVWGTPAARSCEVRPWFGNLSLHALLLSDVGLMMPSNSVFRRSNLDCFSCFRFRPFVPHIPFDFYLVSTLAPVHHCSLVVSWNPASLC